jgi:hypothetical protein
VVPAAAIVERTSKAWGLEVKTRWSPAHRLSKPEASARCIKLRSFLGSSPAGATIPNFKSGIKSFLSVDSKEEL